MADLNNLTTLAKRLRPLLGNFVQGLVKSVIGEGPGIDLTVSGDITSVGLGGDTILLYHSDQSPVNEYAFTGAELTAAIAAAASGDIIIIPAGQIVLTGGGFAPGVEITSGALSVTDSDGDLISGLVIGSLYCIEVFGGPWNWGFEDVRYFDLSIDGGSVWTGGPQSYTPGMIYPNMVLPAWADYLECAAYCGLGVQLKAYRVYWQATTDNIRIRVSDNVFIDNTGALSWRISGAAGETSIPSGVEVVGLGRNSILVGSVANNGTLTNLQVTGNITGTGIIRLVNHNTEDIFNNVIKSTLADGTAPLDVTSTTLNINLNADLLDGHHASDFLTGALPDHDHSGDAGDGGQFEAENLLSTGENDGDVLTANGTGGVAWETPTVGGGSASSDPVFQVEGALVVTADADGVYICPRSATILAVYIYCRDPGSASSTKVDVNLNGVTIFTTQANRPELAWNDANQVAKSGVPDVTAVVENDVLSIDIDQIGTGAADLTVVIAFSLSAPANLVKETILTFSGDLSISDNPLRIYNKLGSSQTISQVFLSIGTAPVGDSVIVDVHKNGVTIFTNQAHRPVITTGNNSGFTTTIDVSAWADGDYFTAHVDNVGSGGTEGSDLVVHIIHS